MNSYTEQGIVLSTVKFSENRIIAHILTRSRGRCSFITKAVARNRGTGRNLFQPLYLLEITATKSRGEIDKIEQVEMSTPLYNIPFDIVKSSVALFIAEIMYRLIKDNECDERLFDFLYNSVVTLDSSDSSTANFHLYFMVRLTYYLGFAPQGHYTHGCWTDIKNGEFTYQEPPHALKLGQWQTALFYDLMNTPVHHLHKIALNRNQRSDFLDAMVSLYGYHTDSIYSVNSISVFREIF